MLEIYITGSRKLYIYTLSNFQRSLHENKFKDLLLEPKDVLKENIY